MTFNFISLIWIKDVTFIGLLLLSLYHTLYLLIFSQVFKKKFSLFNKALSWVILEWLRCEVIAVGSPFLSVGSAFSDFPVLTQISSIGGIHLISFWALLVVLLSLSFINNESRKIKSLIPLLLLITIPYLYGVIKLNRNKPNPVTNPLHISIIQPNISPEIKWSIETEKQQLEIIKNLILNFSDNTDLLVLPETVFTYDYRSNLKVKGFLKNLTKNKNSMILFGAIDDLSKNNVSYNGAFLLDQNLKLQSVYHKKNLVPFGEYIPFKKWMPEFECLTPIGDGFEAGNKLPYMNLTKNITTAPLICFEDCLSSFVRNVCHQDIDLILTITNNGWFRSIKGPLMLERLARFRAVENGVPLIRCANTGVSSYIDPYGRVLQRIEDKKRQFVNISGVMNCKIYKKDKSRTIFSFIGYWWILALIIVSYKNKLLQYR